LEKVKLFVDILSGVLIPLAVLFVPMFRGHIELRTWFYYSLAAMLFVGSAAVGIGFWSGSYSSEDPLTVLSESQIKYFTIINQNYSNGTLYLPKLHLRQLTRYIFVRNMCLYEVDSINGSIETSSNGMWLHTQRIINQKSGPKDDHYYDMSKHDAQPKELPIRETIVS
jgi:hypothetical protein